MGALLGLPALATSDVGALRTEQEPGVSAPPAVGATDALVAQAEESLAGGHRLLAVNDADHESDLHRAIALAQEGTRWQADAFGLHPAPAVPKPAFNAPSEALHALAALHGLTPDASQAAAMAGLDSVAEPLRSALTDLIRAFLALDAAGVAAYAELDLDAVMKPAPDGDERRLMDETEYLSQPDLTARSVALPSDAFRELGIDLTLLMPTRNQFLDSILTLHDALRTTGAPAANDCEPIQLSPAFSIDLADCDNVYTDDYAFLLDVGGTDRYLNNAGGTSLDGGAGMREDTCFSPPTEPRGAAALIDLGTGNDRYGNGLRGCAVNGGGIRAQGVLLDQGGNDVYHTPYGSTNGGGWNGSGTLVDVAGDDTYTATRTGTNGGSNLGGAGMLVDAAGSDLYTAARAGTNGGSAAPGAGFLFDGGGNDVFTAADLGTNGGTYNGLGFLVTASGHDRYTATTCGVNGGSSSCNLPPVGVGLLLDRAGGDTYQETGSFCTDCSQSLKGIIGSQEDL